MLGGNWDHVIGFPTVKAKSLRVKSHTIFEIYIFVYEVYRMSLESSRRDVVSDFKFDQDWRKLWKTNIYFSGFEVEEIVQELIMTKL